MDEAKAVFSVVLRSDLPKTELELLSKLAACKITDPTSDNWLLQFRCTDITFDGGYYLAMDAFKPGDDFVMPIRIPNHYVLLIIGDRDHPSIGFTSLDSAPAS
jgi:hypothetical protein